MEKAIALSTINFDDGKPARLLRVPPEVEVGQIITSLDLPGSRAVLVINGGAANLKNNVSKKLAGLFTELARFVIEKKITVVTGGTNSGVFAVLGQALKSKGGAAAPCVGVSTTGHGVFDKLRLEENHTHFVLISAHKWEMATKIMYGLVETLASNKPSLTVFAGGGEFTVMEMEWNAKQNREMVLISGSKGYTDEVLAARSRRSAELNSFVNLVKYEKITAFDIDRTSIDFTKYIARKLHIDLGEKA